MSTQYRYEYGQRWNAKLPRNDIRFLVHRMHSGTDENKVAEEIAQRAIASGIPSRMIAACKRYAVCVHRKQKELYVSVLIGKI